MKKFMKKLTGVLLAASMLFTMLPASAFAAENETEIPIEQTALMEDSFEAESEAVTENNGGTAESEEVTENGEVTEKIETVTESCIDTEEPAADEMVSEEEAQEEQEIQEESDISAILLAAGDSSSEYSISLGADGLLSGYDGIDETSHTIGEQTVSRTYVLSFRDETFSVTNSTGSMIQKTEIILAGGTNPTTCSFAKGGNRNASYLDTTAKARFTDSSLLTAAGYTGLDEEATAYYYLYFSAVDYALLIQITPNGAGDPVVTARRSLEEEIGRVTGENAACYYQADDRYNGKTASENGFWADLQEVLSNAQTIYDNSAATLDDLTGAKETLSAAIDSLIPVTCINTTELYEAIQKYQSLLWSGSKGNTAKPGTYKEGDMTTPVKESNTSTYSWAGYQNALTTARNLLNRMYDTDGVPTASNDSQNEELAGEITEAISGLKASVDALEPAADETKQMDAKIALAGIDLYANTLYGPDRISAEKYTKDSYAAYQEARESALELAKNSSAYSGMGSISATNCINAYTALRNACYALQEKDKTGITVHFSAADTYAMSRDVDSMGVNTTDLTLPAGATVSDALEQAGVELSSLGKLNEKNAVFINGIFLTKSSIYSVSPPETQPYDITDIHLQDGDELTVMRFLPSWYINTFYDDEWLYSIYDKPDAVKYADISLDDAEKYAGTAFELDVSCDGALSTTYTGKKTPFAGAKIFVSDACESEKAARTAAVTTDTEAVTDDQGRASLVLYEGGWYALNVLAPGNGNCLGCQTVIFHVNEADDLDAIKTQLTEKLTSCYEKYEEGFYKAEDWETVDSAYTEAVTGIKEAATSGDARRAQQTAMKTIRTAQEKAEGYNETNLKKFRTSLDSLPDDTGKLDQSACDTITKLQSYYEQMTVYQTEQLTRAEKSKYDAIISANEKGLPEAKKYNLSFEVKMDGGSDADLATLNEMLSWINENNGIDDAVTDITGGNNLPNVDSFGYSSKSWNSYETVNSCVAMKKLYACISPDQAIYLRVRDAGGEITGDGWSISDKNIELAADDLLNARLYRHMVYTINGTVYEISDVSVDGLDADEYETTELQFFDTSTYKDKDKDCVNLSFPDSFLEFKVPFNDVKVTVTWKPVVTAGSDLSEKKNAAEEAIRSLFETYDESAYDPSVWTSIAAAETVGLAAVENASSEEAVADAEESAVSEMLQYGQTANMAGKEELDLPDYGEVAGRVYISIANNTWEDAPEEFLDTFVSGWYDLCEKDTMMTCILKAMAMAEPKISWTGTGGDTYGISYLSGLYIDENENGKKDKSEPGIAEFDNGSLSGWMGTLNDWFTNFGFQEFGYENGQLQSGDVISIQYTSEGAGEDLGGTWGNSDTTLSSLDISGGTLSPAFDAKIREYTLTIPDNRDSVKVTTKANNKNYQVRTYLNYYDNDDAFYRSTQSFTVKPGDVIYVGCGEYNWPSMNNQETEERYYTGTKYTVRVVSGGSAKQAEELIGSIQMVKYSNYQSQQNAVQNARAAYDALSDTAKAEIDASVYEKLTVAEQLTAEYTALDVFRAELAAVDPDTVDEVAGSQLIKTYESLTENQAEQLTFAEVKKAETVSEAVKKAAADREKAEAEKEAAEKAAAEKAKADAAAAKTVTNQINALGTVTLDSKNAIESARAAYNALTDDQKKYVDASVLAVLEKVEKSYAEQKAADDKAKADAARPVNKITASSLVKEYNTVKKNYSIGAKVLGGAKLTYTSGSSKIKVSSSGVITVPAKFVGKAVITIKAAETSKYKAASKKITITVNPKTVSLVSVKNAASKKMTVKWKKNSAVTGYQLQYSTDKAFASGNKTVTVSKNKTVTKTIKSLKKGKTYYVRIRTYKKVGSTKYYSKWSGVKKVKIAK